MTFLLCNKILKKRNQKYYPLTLRISESQFEVINKIKSESAGLSRNKIVQIFLDYSMLEYLKFKEKFDQEFLKIEKL